MTWLVVLAESFGASIVLTGAVRWIARRRGLVAEPRPDRWHHKPTALFGGVALTLAVLGTLAAQQPWPSRVGVLVLGSLGMFALGLWDDWRELRPQTKLVVQILGASLLLVFDIRLRWTGVALIDGLLTLLWIVGITNAVNLLDNMDGLAAGIVAIASAVLAFFFVYHGQPGPALAACALTGACLGYLIFNFSPASIFMGDCGSMFLGYFIGGLALLSDYGRARNIAATLAVPLLVLLVPIFDTVFVTLVRKLSGRPISLGGRDHTSHRLAAIGVSERGAVLTLYGMSALSGALAILVRLGRVHVAFALVVPFLIVVAFIGVYLAREKMVVARDVSGPQSGLVRLLSDIAYKRRIFEVLSDVVLVALAYYAAFLLRYDGEPPAESLTIVARTLPILVGAKLAAFLVLGMYRGLWRYVGIEDAVTIFKATAAGSALFAVSTFLLYRLEGFPRSILVLDAVLCLLLVGGSRMSFRLLRSLLDHRHLARAKRVLIFGAGDGGELVLREILNNEKLGMVAVGFVDDERRLWGRVIHGIEVLGGSAEIPSLVRRHDVKIVVLSTQQIQKETMAARFREVPVDFQQLEISIDTR